MGGWARDVRGRTVDVLVRTHGLTHYSLCVNRPCVPVLGSRCARAHGRRTGPRAWFASFLAMCQEALVGFTLHKGARTRGNDWANGAGGHGDSIGGATNTKPSAEVSGTDLAIVFISVFPTVKILHTRTSARNSSPHEWGKVGRGQRLT